MFKNLKRPALFLASLLAIYFLAFQLGFSYTNISHFLNKDSQSSKILEFNKPESKNFELKYDSNLDLYYYFNLGESILFSKPLIAESKSYFSFTKLRFVDLDLYDLFHQWKFHL